MDAFDTVVLDSSTLIDRIAQDLFEIMPEEGISLVFVDTHGNWWSSQADTPFGDTDEASLIQSLTGRIDDGEDPAVLKVGEVCVIGSQLIRDYMHWGYVMLVFPQRGVETGAINLDLADLVLRQTNLLVQTYGQG